MDTEEALGKLAEKLAELNDIGLERLYVGPPPGASTHALIEV